MDSSRRSGAQSESRSRTILSPYDPVHASTGPAPPISSHRHFLHRHQESIDSAVSIVETMNNVAELYPSLQSRLPGPSTITNVGLSPSVAHHPFVQLHPPTETWVIPGISSHPLLPVSFPHSGHRPIQTSAAPSEPGLGRDHLSFTSNSATGVGAPGVTGEMNSPPYSSTEPERGNLEQEPERNSLQTDAMLSHPPALAHGHSYSPTSTQQSPGSNERHYHHFHQPPTNTYASTQQSTVQLIPPPTLPRRPQAFIPHRSRRAMASQTTGGQTHRVERQHIHRNLGSNGSSNRSRAEGHSRRTAPWSARGESMLHTRDAQLHSNIVSNKWLANKRAMLSLEPVNISELPADERTCIICYNDFGDESPEGHAETPLRLPKCKHVFGDLCIKKWFEDSSNCPYCRDKVGKLKMPDSHVSQLVDIARDSGYIGSDEHSEELIRSFFQMENSEQRRIPVYPRLSRPTDRRPQPAEEQNRNRSWTVHQSRTPNTSADLTSRTPRSETLTGRYTPVQRDEIMITPPPLAAPDMDSSMANAPPPTHNHLQREEMMATPPSGTQRGPPRHSPNGLAIPEHNMTLSRPRDIFGNLIITNPSAQGMASNPEAAQANMLQDIPLLPEFPGNPLLFNSHPGQFPRDGPYFLPSLGSGPTHHRPGRGRHC